MDRNSPNIDANPGSVVTNPSWPSLYNPRSELFSIQHHNPISPNGFYLVDSGDVFRFTLYWTLVFYIPVFVIFGLYAFFNLSFPPAKTNGRKNGLRASHQHDETEDDYGDEREEGILMTPRPSRTLPNGYETLRSDITSLPSSPHFRSPTSASHPILLSPSTPAGLLYPPSPTTRISRNPRQRNKKRKLKNERRSRVTFALLVLLSFLLLSLIGAVISSAIVGYVLTGLYRAGKFYMSTWVPFLWAAISVMVGMLNVWPSVINII
ncbi:hypothetical protein GYMLUDRAFT_207788 [Collybiopsis luxurians FD-317 M1]|uniref:Uncharacterized protein n=1 Tax=Collybiopsis luxurians FD-317 M1 TaxID=944289 RepID=A0A0D0ARC0_9AGAR|nr:hypothetical protein GYMLUDRAFT_207788 [Collybiopsis luxurians FD-317 M1]